MFSDARAPEPTPADEPAKSAPTYTADKQRGRAQRLLNAYCFLNVASIAREPGLIATKWPAYHDLDPMAANMKFGEAFQKAFRDQFRRDVDFREADKVQGLNLANIMYPKDGRKRGELTVINTVRQLADSYGLPYKPFIKFCMQFASDRGVRHIARPNQLIPTNPKFRAAWEKKFIQFSKDFSETMISEYREERARGASGRPGCVGVPGARNAASAGCQICPLADKCAILADGVVKIAELKSQEDGAPRSHADKTAAVLTKRNRVKAERERAHRAVHGRRTKKVSSEVVASPSP